MKNFKELLKNNIIVIILFSIALASGVCLYFKTEEKENMQNIFEEVENNVTTNTVENENTEEAKKIAIHITGEVKKTGVIYLKVGSRIIDAIEKAGGTTKNADLSKVNLAYVLLDGQKLYIPNKKDKISEYISEGGGQNVITGTEANSNTEMNKSKKININTAGKEELQKISGIGPSLAEKIISYRNSNGKFKKIEDIKNVNGIGENKYRNIKGSICI